MRENAIYLISFTSVMNFVPVSTRGVKVEENPSLSAKQGNKNLNYPLSQSNITAYNKSGISAAGSLMADLKLISEIPFGSVSLK